MFYGWRVLLFCLEQVVFLQGYCSPLGPRFSLCFLRRPRLPWGHLYTWCNILRLYKIFLKLKIIIIYESACPAWIGNEKMWFPPKRKCSLFRPVHLSLSEDFSVVSPERNCLKLVGWSWGSSATPAALNLMYVLILVGVEAADIELVGMILGICGGIVLLLLLALLICILCRR